MHGLCELCNDYLVWKWGYDCISGVGMRMVSEVALWCRVWYQWHVIEHGVAWGWMHQFRCGMLNA